MSVSKRWLATPGGLSSLPEIFDVHHVDGDKKNNAIDNLALVTPKAHAAIHGRELDSTSLALKRSTLAEALRSSTSP